MGYGSEASRVDSGSSGLGAAACGEGGRRLRVQTSTVYFAYPPPTVTSVAPLAGPTAGGLELTIEGANFGDGSATTATVPVCSSAFASTVFPSTKTR